MSTEPTIAPDYDTRRPLRLLAAGYNAFAQLSDHRTDDAIRTFYPVLTEQGSEHARVLFSGWSCTVLVVGTRLVGLGGRVFEQHLSPAVADSLRCGFGDHEGMIGCLDAVGRLYLLSDGDGGSKLALYHEGADAEALPLIQDIALADNGSLAVVVDDSEAVSKGESKVVQFGAWPEFLTWLDNSSHPQSESNVAHLIQGESRSVIANTASYLCQTESGEVYSWGDPRYHSLGRAIVGDDSIVADRPGQIIALGGLNIAKVACGGWMSAAVSQDGALYIWGTETPGTEQAIRPLREADAGGVVLVSITEGEGVPLDVVDVGVGDSHIALVDENHSLWVIGDNSHGQLGLESAEPFVADWIQVPGLNGIRGVICGPKCTFIYIEGGERPD